MGLTVAIIGVAAAAGSSAMNAKAQAGSKRAQARLEEAQARFDADRADRLAEQELLDAERDVHLLMGRASDILGAQTTGYAGGNIDVASPVVQAVLTDTIMAASSDIVAIRTNALREAYSLKSEASNLRFRGRINTLGLRAQAKSTEKTGALEAISSGLKGAYQLGAFDSAPGDLPGTSGLKNYDYKGPVSQGVKLPDYGGLG